MLARRFSALVCRRVSTLAKLESFGEGGAVEAEGRVGDEFHARSAAGGAV